MNAQHAVLICLTLKDMGYPQPSASLRTNNFTAQKILSGVCKQKRSKYNEMNFHQIRCRVRQRQFQVTWAPGKENFRDTPTIHHPASHYKKMRPSNLYVKVKSPSTLKRCITIMTQTLVIQSKNNIVTSAATLTHRISTIVK